MIVGAGYKTQDGVGNRRLEVKDWLLEVGDWGDWTVRIRCWRLKDALLKTEGMKVPVRRPGCWASLGQDSHLLPQTLFTYWDGHRCNENWGVGGWTSAQRRFHVIVWVARNPKSEWFWGRQA